MNPIQEAIRNAIQTDLESFGATSTDLGAGAQQSADVQTHLDTMTQRRVQGEVDALPMNDKFMLTNPLYYAATKAGTGMIGRGADLADSAGRALGMTEGSPVSDAVRPVLPDTSRVDALHEGNPMEYVGKGADFAGKMTPDAIVGGGAGMALGKGVQLMGKVAPAASRLHQYMDAAGKAIRNFGAGPSPLPAAGNLANAGARIGGAAAAGGAAGAVLNPEAPASGAAIGAVAGQLGPAAHAAGRVGNAALDQVLPSRQPAVADEFLRRSLGPGAPGINQRFAAEAARPPVMDRMPYQTADMPEVAGVHEFLLKHDPGYAQRVAAHGGRQGRQLHGEFDKRTAGLANDEVNRDLQTGPMNAWLLEHNLPIRMDEQAFMKSNTPNGLPLIPGRSPLGVIEDVRTRNTTRPENEADILRGLKPLERHARPDGAMPTPPAGDYVASTQRLNELQRSAYRLNGGPAKVDETSAPMLGEIADSISTMLANPSRMATTERKELARIFQQWQDTYKQLSKPINQKEILSDVRDAAKGTDLLPGAAGSRRRNAIEPAKFTAQVDRLINANGGKVWAQLTPEQQTFLVRARDELVDNAKAGSNGIDPRANLPMGMRNPRALPDADPGWVLASPKTAGLLSLGRNLSGGQRAGVLAQAGERMGDRQSLQALIDDVIAGRSRQYPTTDALTTLLGRSSPAVANTRHRN